LESQRLKDILRGFCRVRLLVLGDYFLDEYLVVDPSLTETSIETGLEARQVVEIRNSPGAAGTVCSNLVAMGAQVEAMGIIGDDGNGYELVRGLKERGVGTELMVMAADRSTPTYTKPMKKLPDGTEDEMERIDIKNRSATPFVLEQRVLANLRAAVQSVDGVIIGDQVDEDECGVVTAKVRAELARLSVQNRGKVFFADSRSRIGKFSEVMIKPNEKEAAAVVGTGLDEDKLVRGLYRIARKPVFLTRGEQGILIYDGRKSWHCPAVPVCGPIDIVGAGDSATAGIVAALCSGASLVEAGEIGNLAASVTIRKLGTTGTASQQEVLEAFERMAG